MNNSSPLHKASADLLADIISDSVFDTAAEECRPFRSHLPSAYRSDFREFLKKELVRLGWECTSSESDVSECGVAGVLDLLSDLTSVVTNIIRSVFMEADQREAIEKHITKLTHSINAARKSSNVNRS